MKNKILLGFLTVIFITCNVLNVPWFPRANSRPSESANLSRTPRRWELFKRRMTQSHPHSLMYNYFRELRSDYEGPTEGLLHFLNKNAQKDDSIFTANAGYVLHFWTGLKITNEIPFQSPPTWLIRLGTVSWGRQVCENNGLDADQYIKDYLKSYNYQVILLDYPNILYENEPVLFRHYWVTPTQQSPIALYWYPPRP